MSYPVPAGTEASYIGFAVASALIDFLVSKNTISPDELWELFEAARKSIGESGDFLRSEARSSSLTRCCRKN